MAHMHVAKTVDFYSKIRWDGVSEHCSRTNSSATLSGLWNQSREMSPDTQLTRP